jgi:hypothetical protein
MVRRAGLEGHLPREYVRDSACNACYALFSNPVIRDYLCGLEDDREFVEKVAYARVYYLEEQAMALQLQGEPR